MCICLQLMISNFQKVPILTPGNNTFAMPRIEYSHFCLIFLCSSFLFINPESIDTPFRWIYKVSSTPLATRFYVRENGTGTGNSWENASGNLQEILAQAKAQDEIWVAKGTYYPTNNADRNATFHIPNQVKLYGGFDGTEKYLSERNVKLHTSVLSGDIGKKGKVEDNSFTIVYFDRVEENTLLDGFLIFSGYANGTGEIGSLERCGAGIFNNAANGPSHPVIRNCSFQQNFARDGAAIFNYAKNNASNPTIEQCTFLYNKSDLSGGSIYNYAEEGTCSPIVSCSRFDKNESSYGAGIFNHALKNGTTQPLIFECSFSHNTAYMKGAAVFDRPEDGGQTGAIINRCHFEDNAQSIGDDTDQRKGSSKLQQKHEIICTGG